MGEASLAFIGGSGLYTIDGLRDTRAIHVDTPFGPPSDDVIIGVLEDTHVAFLPRHGRGHRILPSEIPARANIYALKSLGVERIVSVSAVGSLKEHIKPLDLLIPDQLIDRTKGRLSTFFGEGIAAHVGFADPFCPDLSAALTRAAQNQNAPPHVGGTYVVMEGPQFSTRAESDLYRNLGASVVGMTALPEAKLAREAEICYSTLALVTDYDCWHLSEETVSVELVVDNLRKNAQTSQRVLKALISEIPSARRCACASSLKDAIITSPDLIPASARERLSAIIGNYLAETVEVR